MTRLTIAQAILQGLAPERRGTFISNGVLDPAEANQRRREFERERLHEKHMERLRAAREQS